jgi:hypothetical protein
MQPLSFVRRFLASIVLIVLVRIPKTEKNNALLVDEVRT